VNGSGALPRRLQAENTGTAQSTEMPIGSGFDSRPLFWTLVH
jgi:hypothetical protein